MLRRLLAASLALGSTLFAGGADAQSKGFLETLRRQTIVTTTIPDTGDQNPYAVVVAPVSAGMIEKNDVLVTNFNNAGNLQGLGTTIVIWRQSAKKLLTFAKLPRKMAQCPGGIGLGTAMTMLSSGWVIVGSAPSDDGTTATLGAGCLIVLDPRGQVASVWTGDEINAPWGNMAVADNGGTATIFVSNAGFGIGAPGDPSPVVNRATVLRLELATQAGRPPTITRRTVVGSGFSAQADKDVFLIGPTGLALGRDGTLYVSDAVGNRVTAIADALTRKDSAGTGREITKDGFLRRPLAMVTAPNGHLLVINGMNGQVVEVDAIAGKQLYARWIDANRAQTPPGAGDLFGIAMTPDGDGFYFVMDEVNMLALAK